MNVRLSVLLLTVALCAIPAAGDEPLAPLVLPTHMNVAEDDVRQSLRLVPIGLLVAMPTTVTLTVTAESGDARLGFDYEAVVEVVTFLPGETQKQVPIWIIGDTFDENPEAFLLRVAQNGIHRGSVLMTIYDDDRYPFVTVDDTVVTEQARTTFAIFRFKASHSPKNGGSIQYTTEDGTAIAGQDYVAKSGTIGFSMGETSGEVRVEVIDDTAFEGDETFSIRLGESNGYLIWPDKGATATIVSDDPITPPLTLMLSAQEELEGDSGSRQIQLKVTLTAPASFPVTVSVEPTGAGSALAGSDYAMLPQSLTFAPGVTEQAAYATIFGDLDNESHEEFEVAVLEDGVVRATALVRIFDDDSRVKPAVSVADVELSEGDGPSQAVFVVTLSKAATAPVRVSFHTAGDTASAPGDYEHVTGDVVFVPGETSRTVTVTVAGDDVHEETETFRLELSNGAGLTIADGSALCSIADDDPPKRRAMRH